LSRFIAAEAELMCSSTSTYRTPSSFGSVPPAVMVLGQDQRQQLALRMVMSAVAVVGSVSSVVRTAVW
jgi:hypothetical protein